MRRWIAHLILLIVGLLSRPAIAQSGGSPAALSYCHAQGAVGGTVAAAVADGVRWQCDDRLPGTTSQRVLLRFDQAESAGARYFAARPTLFDGLTLAVMRDGRIVAERHYEASELVAGPGPNFFRVPLPTAVARGEQVVAAFDNPGSRGLFSDAAIYRDDPLGGRAMLASWLVAAAVCGMLLMPLAFNAAYYRALRENFVLWHLAVTFALLAQCEITSGLAGLFIDIPVPVHARITILTGGLAASAAAIFCAAFIERDKLHPRLRKGLHAAAGYAFVATVLHATVPDVVSKALYYAGFIPVIVLAVAVMTDARRRGSRAVNYQIAAWSPIIVMGMIRITTMLVPTLPALEVMPLFYFAMVVQSATTSLGIADRFLVIKRQRDSALDQAESFERLSERDDLTGLFNRRALDGSLGDFTAQRFTGFALFDLDHFKRVNDTHGHAAGDAVLKTVAGVLGNHEGSVALRLGGEEFLLLLRGEGVEARVERLREAIPVRIAREVTELETLVTASVGLLEAKPGSDIGSDFAMLYRQADGLLYEAKHNGRNLLAAVRLHAETARERPVRIAVG